MFFGSTKFLNYKYYNTFTFIQVCFKFILVVYVNVFYCFIYFVHVYLGYIIYMEFKLWCILLTVAADNISRFEGAMVIREICLVNCSANICAYTKRRLYITIKVYKYLILLKMSIYYSIYK